MKIVIASDHAGFKLKQIIFEYLVNKKNIIKDMGCFSEKSVDYPDFAIKACEYIINRKANLGILICGTGIGMSITANKIKGIHCALCNNIYSAKMARKHNNANVLAIGSRLLKNRKNIFKIVDLFINSVFDGDRHKIRINKILKIEELNKKIND